MGTACCTTDVSRRETSVVNVIDIIRLIMLEVENEIERVSHYMAVKPRSRVSKRLFFRFGVLGALSVSPKASVTSSEDLLAGDLWVREVEEVSELPIFVDDEEEFGPVMDEAKLAGRCKLELEEVSGKYEAGEVEVGSSVLEAVRKNDIDLRRVCHDLGRSDSMLDSIKPKPALDPKTALGPKSPFGPTSMLSGK